MSQMEEYALRTEFSVFTKDRNVVLPIKALVAVKLLVAVSDPALRVPVTFNEDIVPVR